MQRRESGMHCVATVGLSFVLSLACAGEGISATGKPAASAGKEVPMSSTDLLRPEDAARAFANAPRAVVKMPNGRAVVAVVADTPERTMYGYMFRREVKEDEGMVFVYPEAGM